MGTLGTWKFHSFMPIKGFMDLHRSSWIFYYDRFYGMPVQTCKVCATMCLQCNRFLHSRCNFCIRIPLGKFGWFFSTSFGVATIFLFILFFQAFHHIFSLNLFYMMGVAGVLGATLLCTIHGTIVENTLFKDGDGGNTLHAFIPINQFKETYSMVIQNHFWSQIFGVALSKKYWLHFFMLFMPMIGLLMSAME